MNDHDSPFEPVAAQRTAPAASLPTEGSFPLIALIQLATFLAGMIVCIDGARLRQVLQQVPHELPLTVGLIFAACTAAGTVGFCIGLGQVRRWRSALFGGAMGLLYGLGILAAYVAPASLERAAGAAAVLVLSTVLLRFRSA